MKQHFETLAPKCFLTTSLLNDQCGTHLVVLTQRCKGDQIEDWFCYGIYNEDTKKYSLHIDFQTAKAKFLKHCEALLKESQQTKDILPW